MTVERIEVLHPQQWHSMRRDLVTASDVGCLFDCHPYKTIFQLYAEKTGRHTVAETDLMRGGKWLEDAVINAARDKYPGWKFDKPGIFLRDLDWSVGATPDCVAHAGGREMIVQCKVIGKHGFDTKWQDGPPLFYQLQTLVEAMLWESPVAYLAVLVVGDWARDFHMFQVDRNAGAEFAIKERCRDFIDMIADGKQPAPDYSKDAEAIKNLYRPNGQAVDMTGDNQLGELCELLEKARAGESEHAAKKEMLAAQIIEKIGGATSVTCGEFSLTYKQVDVAEKLRKAYSFTPLNMRRKKGSASRG